MAMASKKNPPYAVCAYCGATLDKGERCDCAAASGKEPAIKLCKTPEEEREAEERRQWIINGIGRRRSDSRE